MIREFVDLLLTLDKKFIIIGRVDLISYKPFFKHLQNQSIWLGYTTYNETFFRFEMPYDESIFIKKDIVIKENDKFYLEFNNIYWYSNFGEKHYASSQIELTKKYNPKDYPFYDNFNAINVQKVFDIPLDYDGYMGVPITFLEKFNPEQFEIIGIMASSTNEEAGIPNLKYYNSYNQYDNDSNLIQVGACKINGHPVIKGRVKKNCYYKNPKTGEVVSSLFPKIVIKRVNPK